MDISVIMPAFNAEKYISKAIESVLSQKFKGTFELLIADDASTDSTPQIITKYQTLYPETVKPIFRKNNIGYSANYYELIKKAEGKYLAILDNDDIWVSESKLQIQYDFMEKNHEIGMLCGDTQIIDELDIVKSNETRHEEGVVSLEEIMCGHTYLYSPSLMMRAAVFNDLIKEDDSKWYIENKSFYDDMWAFYFAHQSRIYWKKESLAAYRILKNSGCHTSETNKQFELGLRYYKLKLHFLLSHDVDLQEKEKILLSEYDKLYRDAFYRGELNVRNSKSYRMGKLISKLKFWKK